MKFLTFIVSVYLGAEKLQKILSELSVKQNEICKKYEQVICEISETMKGFFLSLLITLI